MVVNVKVYGRAIYVGRHTSGSSINVECWSIGGIGPPGDIAFGEVAIRAMSSCDALLVGHCRWLVVMCVREDIVIQWVVCGEEREKKKRRTMGDAFRFNWIIMQQLDERHTVC